MKKIALVRGKFLNAYEMQIFEPIAKKYDITAFGSLYPFHSNFIFSTVKLPSPTDIPEFPKKMSVLNRLFTDAHYLYGLEEKLKGFDIVHSAETYFHYTQQALDARKKGYVKKVIATILENIPFNNEGIRGRREFKERARNELDHMIALTQRTKDALILEGADPTKITVVSHGIDTKRFVPRKNWLQNEKSKKSFNILFSGRLEVYKGVYEILYAAKLLLSDPELKNYTLQFVFVGQGSEKEKLLDLEKKLHIQKFVKYKVVEYEDMAHVYQEADIFLAPSKPTLTYQEQYCTALLEAQAVGLPIVTTYSGGIPENIADAGVMVGPGDFYSLKEAIKKLILNPELRISYARKARKRAENVHDSRIIAQQIADVYEKVLS